MSKKEQKIIDNLTAVGISVDLNALKEFSSAEKDKLERLSERMSYLHAKLKKDPTAPQNKLQFLKEEFRALEWVFYEFNIIAEGAKKTEL